MMRRIIRKERTEILAAPRTGKPASSGVVIGSAVRATRAARTGSPAARRAGPTTAVSVGRGTRNPLRDRNRSVPVRGHDLNNLNEIPVHRVPQVARDTSRGGVTVQYHDIGYRLYQDICYTRV